MQCNNKNVEWTSISKSTLQGDMKQLRKYIVNEHRQTHETRKKNKMQNRPHIQKIILDENSYANAGMSSHLSCLLSKRQCFCFFVFFCSFFVFWWILISLSLPFRRIREGFSTCRVNASCERIISQGRKQTLVGWLKIFLVFLWAGLGFVWNKTRTKRNKNESIQTAYLLGCPKITSKLGLDQRKK